MTRFIRAALLLGLVPATVTASDPVPPTKLPGTIIPATPELCGTAPTACHGLPMSPTVPPCAVACPTGKPSVLDRLSLGSRGKCDTGRCDRGGVDLSRLKEWFCWKPSAGSGLPLARPTPYHAPLLAYFPHCQEPGMGACGGCGPTAGCAGGGCAVPQAQPVALPKTDAPAVPPVMLPPAKPVKQVGHTTSMIKPIERAAKPFTNP